MRVEGVWVGRPETAEVFRVLTGAGWAAFFVGGCVRNALLGQPVDDIDIATNARPEIVTDLAESAGLRVVQTGAVHGTVTVLSRGVPHEVTTFRRDVETFGRHATVSFTSDMHEDAARRDFTMNALYATGSGEVVDPLGGLVDLRAGRVRFVGDPAARIAEDYLRILRFFRFHAWYGDPAGGLDPEGLAACADLADGIAQLSHERIGAEMRKLLAAPDPALSVAAMAQIGVLGRVLPGADARALPVLVHLEADTPSVPPDWLSRLAVLGGEGVTDALRLSRAEAARLAALRNAAQSARSAAEVGHALGARDATLALWIRGAWMGQPLPEGWEADVGRGAAARFPVAASDLMPALSGPALGAKLAELEARWIASGFRLSRDELLKA